MRISDWSSDVCSSDLGEIVDRGRGIAAGDRIVVRRRERDDDIAVGRLSHGVFVRRPCTAALLVYDHQVLSPVLGCLIHPHARGVFRAASVPYLGYDLASIARSTFLRDGTARSL